MQSRRLIPLVLTLLLAGCATAPVQTPDGAAGSTADTAPDPIRATIVFSAMQMVGVPYQWGGASPAGFDCSGLVQYAYRNAGFTLPRTAAEQLKASAPLTLEHAVAGDLLFFRERGHTSHVAIYLGQGRFVHAPSSGRAVALDTFGNAYYRTHFARAGRIIPL